MKHKFKLTRLWVASLLLLFGISPNLWAGKYASGTDFKVKNQDETWTTINDSYTSCNLGTVSSLSIEEYHIYFDKVNEGTTCYCWLHYAVGDATDEGIQGEYFQDNCWGKASIGKELISSHKLKPGSTYTLYVWYEWKGDQDKASSSWCEGQYWVRKDSKYTVTFTVAAYLAGSGLEGLGWDDNTFMANNTWTKDNVAANTTAQVKVKKKGTWDDAFNTAGSCNVETSYVDNNLQFNTGDHKSKVTISVSDAKINVNVTPYYTVTFNDGTSDVETKEVLSGSTTTAPSDPSKTGYTFDGWYNGNTKFTNSTTITSDITFTAKWTAKEYSITYRDQGDKAYSGNNDGSLIKSHIYDSGITTLVSGTKTGYTFQGWFKEQDCSGTAVTKIGAQEITDNLTLYAKWQEIMSTITIQTPLSTQGSIDITGNKTLGITTGQQIVATPQAGYYLKEWQVSGAARVTDSKNTTTIVYTNGSGEAGTVQAVFEFRWVLRGCRNTEGDPLDGMPGWTTTTDYFEFEANATQGTKTVTLYPNYEYRFIVYDKKSGKQQGWDNQGTLKENDWQKLYKQNGAAILMNTAGYGEYTFSIKEETDQPVVKITNPLSYLITMAPKTYSDGNVSGDTGGTLTAKTTENGQDFEVSNDKYVRDGGSVTFTATPKTGYSFAGFYSDESCTNQITEGVTNNTYTTTITTATSVYAKFTENLTPVTLYIGGNGTVKVGDNVCKGGDIFKVGVYTKVTFTLEPGEHHKFNGWTKSTGADFTMEDNTLKGNGAGRTDGQILTANFVELDKIYFLNKQFDGQYQWPDVYFYYDAYWGDGSFGKYGAGGKEKMVHMTKIEGTDIWWAYVPNNFNGGNVAFSAEDMNGYDNFYQVDGHDSHGVYRTDYKKETNMYVPKKGRSDNPSEDTYYNCEYYSNGYWMKYDPKASEGVGYYLKRTDDYQYGQFKATDFTTDGTLTSTITISVDANSAQTIYVVSAGGEKYADSNGLTKDKKSTVLSKYKDNPSLSFTPNGVGDYTFRLIQGNGLNMSIEVDYPAENGDYRVIYKKEGKKNHPSHAIKAGEKVSFFVHQSGGTFDIQQYSAGSWANKVSSLAVPGTITADGVYVFQLADDGQSLTNEGVYEGDYYIRTDVAAGGWHNYQDNPGNLMTKGTIYGYEGSYDYAYTNWAGQNTNVKFTVANDYSYCISDSTVVSGDILGEGDDKDKLKTEGANIRFMWNSKTNDLKRDYIGGSNDDNEFLLIHGSDNAAAASKTKSKLYETADAASPVNNVKFNDDGNWIYSKEVYVEPGAFAALTAHFNGKTQFFHGAGDASTGAVTTYEQFVGGSGENRLKMKVIYNFKTNELVAGYIPDGETITETINLHSDLLWIRTQQGDATPINFSSTEVRIENIRKIYGVLEFCKDSMTNLYDGATKKPLTNSSYDRINYWISFPFDVRVSEIFGVDGYGEKWVIQYYNGEKRAEIGWFADTKGFWEWLDLDDIMYAGKGYTLNIDPEYFDEPSDDIWKNVDSKVAFYFPSAANYNVNVIKQQEVTTKIPDHEYYRSVKFENDSEKDHKITDSYWNIIGTPAFQPTTISTASSEKHGPNAVYVWKQGDGGDGNGYNIQATMTGFTFKPMRSYIVQYGGEVTWNAVSSIVKAQAPYAYADQKNYMVDLEFYFGEQRDHTYINLSDEATTEFKLNEDVMKMTNSGAPNIYSYAEGYDVAYNEVPMANQTINLGVIARKNGSYTFAMPKDFSGKAVLVDLETGEATDLNLSDYTVELNKGTYNNRFQLLLEVEAKAPTAIDNAKGEWSADGKTKKLFINDNIYLINAGRIYNASGTQVK